MRIMTGNAGQFVGARLLTFAQRQGLHLRNRAKTSLGGASVNKVSGVVCQEFSGTILGELLTSAVDEDFSLQMALLANRITAQRVKLSGIQDFFFTTTRYVLR